MSVSYVSSIFSSLHYSRPSPATSFSFLSLTRPGPQSLPTPTVPVSSPSERPHLRPSSPRRPVGATNVLGLTPPAFRRHVHPGPTTPEASFAPPPHHPPSPSPHSTPWTQGRRVRLSPHSRRPGGPRSRPVTGHLLPLRSSRNPSRPGFPPRPDPSPPCSYFSSGPAAPKHVV